MTCILIYMVQLRTKLCECEVVATEIYKAPVPLCECEIAAAEISKAPVPLCECEAADTEVKFKKVGWQLVTRHFKAKNSPKWALLTAKFWGGFGFSPSDKLINAQVYENFSHPVHVYCYFCLKCRTFCKTSAKRSLYAFLLHNTYRDNTLARTVKLK